ncbi:hypothetical protein EDB85DRAFT_1899620 [Lactarius pseudohatsudake]|nr:hypothetical protein EDB85DRAFT_1899620 [Lactarius pseudohatsudake]
MDHSAHRPTASRSSHGTDLQMLFLFKGSFQRLVLQIPLTAERPDLNFQPNTPAPAQEINATIPNCSCQRCSDAQRGQPVWYPIGQRDNTVAPYVNQGIDNNVETALIAPVRAWAQFIPPANLWRGIQGNFGYAPDPERAGPPNVGFLRAPWPEASIAEGRRRLADRYLNNPDAFVRMTRLEPVINTRVSSFFWHDRKQEYQSVNGAEVQKRVEMSADRRQGMMRDA